MVHLPFRARMRLLKHYEFGIVWLKTRVGIDSNLSSVTTGNYSHTQLLIGAWSMVLSIYSLPPIPLPTMDVLNASTEPF